MLAILSSSLDRVTANDITFLHVISSNKKDIDVEVKPYALAFARKFNLKKVYLLYGEKGKIEYDFEI